MTTRDHVADFRRFVDLAGWGFFAWLRARRLREDLERAEAAVRGKEPTP